MDKKPLHIVSFDNPFPPVYGGVIDVYYKIKALFEAGFAIHLHCIVDTNNATPPPELLEFTHTIHFYRRNKKASFLKLLSTSPFAARSRYSKALANNLKSVAAPILFEGLQTTYVLKKHNFDGQKLLLRLHNVESNYFAGSAASETNSIKKWLYRSEAVKYKSYQDIIGTFDSVLTLSVAETNYVQSKFKNAVYIPVFHGNQNPKTLSSFGKFALYHGDLRLPDNKRAVLFLIDVFSEIPDYSFVIASGDGSDFVRTAIAGKANISHVVIRDQAHLSELLADAHMNVMLSFQESGTKLKLVNSLYNSRFCIINKNMVDDARLQQLCIIAETKSDFIAAVNQLKEMPYDDTNRRETVLKQVLDEAQNASKIKNLLVH